MGMEAFAVFDTDQKVPSGTTPDLLAQLLFEYVPRSAEWMSVPDEDDPVGANWTPKWTAIAEAVAEIERFLGSDAASRMAISGFSTKELVEELKLFCDELRGATSHTARFHLCVY